MELDDMKVAWAAYGAKLERGPVIDDRLLKDVMQDKLRRALAPYVFWNAITFGLALASLPVVVRILAAHSAEPRYIVVVGALAVYVAALVALYAPQLGLRINLSGPVSDIQRDVERIKIAEYRALKWAVLGGVVLWLPAALVLFEALTGVDALARIDQAWLAANLLFGIAILALGHSLSRRYLEWRTPHPRARRLLEALSGRGLQTATRHLAEVATFVRDESPPASPDKRQ